MELSVLLIPNDETAHTTAQLGIVDSIQDLMCQFSTQIKKLIRMSFLPLIYLANRLGVSCVSLNRISNSAMFAVPIILGFANTAGCRLVCNSLVLPYALWRTSRLLFCLSSSSDNTDHLKRCLLFWAIYGQFELFEPLLCYIPFYWLLKLLALLALYLPPFEICHMWYKKWVKPAQGENGLRYVRSLTKFLLYVPTPVSFLALLSTFYAPTTFSDEQVQSRLSSGRSGAS